MANSKDSTPYRIAAPAVKAHTVAEWELGIPPDPTSRSGEKFRLSKKSINVFSTWATVQPATALINTSLPKIRSQNDIGLFPCLLISDQPVIQLLIFHRRSLPGEILCHRPVNDLVPFPLSLIIHKFGIPDRI